ncbi:MAG: FHA domain-containing protein [Chloroflexota bacterium]
MVNDIKTVFQEYTRLRLNGLDAPEAVRTLHPYLQKFDKNTRDELARNMRAWENQRTEKISLLDREKLVQAAKHRDQSNTIDCPSCGKSNSISDAMCYACGTLLTSENGVPTAILSYESIVQEDDAHYAESDTLLFKIENHQPIELRPQHDLKRLLIGRTDKDSPIDVNLDAFGASTKGVSRIHAAVSYDDVSETLSLFDMGSTNGTYINGQLLHANERRTIRHGDELQFGTLKIQVAYKTHA